MMYKFRKTCRLCTNKTFELVLDLGNQPPSNSFLSKKELQKKERKFPLRLYICRKCYHLQLLDVVDKKHLFSNYHYFTSANKPIVEHFREYADHIYKKNLVKKDSPFVIEIGSNDGTLLKEFKKYNVNVLGIEPAENLAAVSRKLKIRTENKFFNYILAKKIAKKEKADLIIANNVLGHVDDLHDFIKGVVKLLKNDGTFVFEVPHALNLIKKLEFDTIYHEHISYFSVIPLSNWLKKYNLEIYNLEKQKVHGGTIRVYVSKKNNFKKNKSVEDMKNVERKYGMTKISTYRNFTRKINDLNILLKKKIISLKNNGYVVFGYGASAKGNVLLNFCQIDNKILDFITDTTKIKQGKFTPGTKIKIIDPKKRPKNNSKMVALLLAWNYKSAIIKNERKFLRNGGKFLIPIPKPRIVSK